MSSASVSPGRFLLIGYKPFSLWQFTVPGYQMHPPPPNLAAIAEVTDCSLVKKASLTGTLPFNSLMSASIKTRAASSL